MDLQHRGTLPFHYGWVIVATGMLAVFASLGLGRFTLGMLLPSMGASLGLSYAEMGFIGTGNFVGYLAAVILSRFGVARFGSRRLVAAALVLVALSMLLVSRANGFLHVLLLYFLTGIGSGAANVPIMGLVAHWFTRGTRGKAAGFIVIGSGFAIMLSGVLIPFVNVHLGAEGWRASWLVLGVVVLMVALGCQALLREDPAEVGLTPVGAGREPPGGSNPLQERPARDVVALLGVVYFLFGFTYVIYVTFIVTTLVQERGFSEAVAGNFWFWLGLLSLLSGPVFGTLSDWLGRRAGLMLVFSLQGLAHLLVAAPLPSGFLYLSMALFGVCAWSIPSIMAAAVGDYMGPRRAVAAFGSITFFFGVGQIAGPSLAGILAEHSGSFASSYLLAAALAALAILLTALLRRPPTR